MVARIKVPGQLFEIGLRPEEADRLALELAKMELAVSTPKMGRPDLEEVRADRRAWIETAMPSHAVDIAEFEIDVYPVTNAQWSAYVDVYGARPAARRGPPEDFVTGISWQEAMQYALDDGGELPTEAEWECAARVDRRLFTWGDAYFPQGDVAFTPPTLETYQVGSRPAANPRGIHDLLGTFGEYTASKFGPYPGANVAAFETLWPNWAGQRVQRGGYDIRQDATTVSRRGVPETERREHMKFRVLRRTSAASLTKSTGPLPGKAAEDFFEEIRALNIKTRAESLARAQARGALYGKEPFDLAKLEKLVDTSSEGRMDSEAVRHARLEEKYYVDYPHVKTLAECAEQMKVLNSWS